MVDYGKWDNIIDSDDSDTEGQSNQLSFKDPSADEDLEQAATLRTEANAFFTRAVDSEGNVTNEEFLMSAVQKYEAALEIGRRERARPKVEAELMLPCHLNAATAAAKLGRFGIGEDHASAALEIESGHVRALYLRGHCRRGNGDLPGALADFETALAAAERAGALGDHADLVEEAEELRGAARGEVAELEAACDRAAAAAARGEWAAAAAAAAGALGRRAFGLLGAGRGLAAAKLGGAAAAAARNPVQALKALRVARSLAEELNSYKDLAEIATIEGTILFRSRQHQKAADCFREGLENMKKIDAQSSSSSLPNKTATSADGGGSDELVYVLDDGGNMVPEVPSINTKKDGSGSTGGGGDGGGAAAAPLLGAKLACNLGLALVQLRHLPEALQHLSAVEARAGELEGSSAGRKLLLKALEGKGDALAYQGSFTEAEDTVLKAKQYAEQWNDEETIVSTLLFLSKIKSVAGDEEAAGRLRARALGAMEAMGEAGQTTGEDRAAGRRLARRAEVHFDAAEAARRRHEGGGAPAAAGDKQWLEQASDQYCKCGELMSQLRRKLPKDQVHRNLSVLMREVEAWFWAGNTAATFDGAGAEESLRKSLNAVELLPSDVKFSGDVLKRKAECIHFLAMSLAKQSKYDSAADYINEAIPIYKLLKDRIAIRDLYKALAILKRRTGDLGKAKEALQTAMGLCKGPSKEELDEENAIRTMISDVEAMEARLKAQEKNTPGMYTHVPEDEDEATRWQNCTVS